MENFLNRKYSDLAGSKPVERASQKKKQQGEKMPYLREERVEAYIDRLEDIITDKRGFELLKYKILEKYVTKPEDVSEKYWENQEAEERKMGRGGDWDNAKSNPDSLEQHKQKFLEIVLNDQRASLEQWVDYFGSSESNYVPNELKYWVFRSILGMQEFVKQKDGEREYIEFPKRSRGTVKPFPDINHEALAYVIDAVKTKFDGKDIEFEHDIQSNEREEFKRFLEKEDFSKLYGWANELMSTVPEHLLPVTEGRWVKYHQGSEPTELVQTIRGKGTGWCTAGQNTATTQLRGGDFYVYYTLDDNQQPTIPRLAIRMEGHDKIAEPPRGIAYKQNLDPYMPPILESKLNEFGKVGEQYKKRAQDMEHLTLVEQKIRNKEGLDKKELEFLYELHSSIEGFGYQKDPRIAELRKGRNVKEDMLTIFECTENEIATSVSHIHDGIKAYVGPLEKGIFEKLPEGLEHVYTSFPEGKIVRDNILVGGESAEQLIAKMESADININSYAKSMLNNKQEFIPSMYAEEIDIVRLKVRDLGFTSSPTVKEIYQRAAELGLELCPPDTGPHYRLKYQDQPLGEWFRIATKPITDSGGDPIVFSVVHYDVGLWLGSGWAGDDDAWDTDAGVAFRVPSRKPA